MNLLATGHAAAMLGDRRLLLVSAVIAETLFIYSDITASSRLTIDRAFIHGNGLKVIETALDDDELISYVRYAGMVDDGEAQAIAVAENRSIPLLSDDNAATRLAQNLGIPIVTTLDLARAWSNNQSAAVVKEAMLGLRFRANYAAPRSHPLRSWYLEVLRDD